MTSTSKASTPSKFVDSSYLTTIAVTTKDSSNFISNLNLQNENNKYVINDEHSEQQQQLLHKKDLINTILPKELILKIFSFLDIVSLCRCAQVSKYWNTLAKNGSNWQSVSLFDFRVTVNYSVAENLSLICGDYLKMLNLRGCRSITDESVKIFSRNCKNLETVNLDDCRQLTDGSCKSLAENCPNIKYLNIASCNVTDISLEAIGKGCRQLIHIDISNCNKIRSIGILNFASECTNLVTFIAVSCSPLTINDESLNFLAENCHKLQTVNLNGCSSVTDIGISYLAQHCPDLSYCNFSKCYSLTDTTLENLAQGVPNLRTLQLIGCMLLTDQGFKTLFKDCKNIENLDLEDCVQITDQTLYNLAHNCSNIKRLALSHCDNITDDGIENLRKLANTIEYLELDHCLRLTDLTIDYLTICKKLKRLDLYDNVRISHQATKKLYTQIPHLVIHTYFQPTVMAEEQQIVEVRPRYRRCCSIL